MHSCHRCMGMISKRSVLFQPRMAAHAPHLQVLTVHTTCRKSQIRSVLVVQPSPRVRLESIANFATWAMVAHSERCSRLSAPDRLPVVVYVDFLEDLLGLVRRETDATRVRSFVPTGDVL